MANSSRLRAPYIFQLLTSLAGIALSVYLALEHTRLKSGIQGGSSFCSFGKYADCNAVNWSPYAEINGVPLASLGALYFVALLIFGGIAPPKSRHFRAAQRWMAWLAASALLVDVYLLGIQAWALRTFCVLCIATYLLSAGNLALNLGMVPPGVNVRWRRAFFSEAGSRSRLPWSYLFLVLVGLAVFAVGLAVLPYSVTPPGTVAGGKDPLTAYLEIFRTEKSVDIPLKSGDGSFGISDAKVKVVSFSDFECPFCQRAASILETALRPMQDKIQVAFKNFPLDSTCNPALERPMHPNACALANLAYCAQEKGKFWEYHDLVFFSLQDKGLRGSIESIGESLKPVLNQSEVKQCLESSRSKQNTREDITLGNKLEIRSTPTVFINGKKVLLPLSVETVTKLVEQELQLADRM